ncbi:MAG: FMN-binding protein [Microbacterium sp.]
MKKIIYAVLATISGLVLVFSYRTSLDAVPPAAVTDPAASTGSTTSTTPSTSDDESSESSSDDESSEGSTSGSSGSTSSGSTSSGTTTTTTSGMTDGTYTGGAANTRYGPVQVQITVSGGVIADVQVIDYPHSDRRDQEINQRALPVLVSETTQAQSSQIDMVSGATYTSQGYIASLQSAIDEANA